MKSKGLFLFTVFFLAEGILTAEGTQAPEPATEELPVVTFAGTFRSGEDVPVDNFSLRYIGEKTGTKIVYNVLPDQDTLTKLNLLPASGERPELISYGPDESDLKWAQAGMLVAIDEHFPTMPDIELSRAENIWDRMRHTDGHIYAIPVGGIQADMGLIYRADWLDKLGFKMPTTIDDYYAYAKAVATQDPDGNGEADTYVMGTRKVVHVYFNHIFGAYGALPLWWHKGPNGKIIAGDVSPGAKEALKVLSKMYAEGLIDPEFVTDNWGRLAAKVNSGRYGAQMYGLYITDETNIYNAHDPFFESNPDARLVVGQPLQAPGYTNIGWGGGAGRGWLKTSVIKESQNPEAAMRVLNWLSSREGQLFANYGLENKHYVIEDGVIKILISTEEQIELGINEVYIDMNELIEHTSTVFQNNVEKISKYITEDPVGGFLFTIPEYSKYRVDLKDLTQVAYTRMIVGEIPVEGGFEDFVKEWYKIGGETVTDAINAAYAKR